MMRYCLMLAFLIATGVPSGCGPLAQFDRFQVQHAVGEHFSLEIFDNSPTFSSALAINATGQIIGYREVPYENGAILSQEPFFIRGTNSDGKDIDGKETTRIPLLKDFSNIEARGLSDNGLVVGYASRPMGNPDGSFTGFVWDSKTGSMTRLPVIQGDIVCYAQSISADGKRISGYTAGAEPARMRPCLWSWNVEQRKWDIEVLEAIDDYNPYLLSSNVLISPDGQRIAACITVAQITDGVYDSSLYHWQQVDGKWQHQLVSDDQMYLCDMNDAGQIAGVITTLEGRMPCAVDASGKVTLIDLLPGDVSGEARGIDSAGTIVGFSDDPHGPTGGPQAFVWKQGKTSQLELPTETTASAAFGINEQGQITGLLDVPGPESQEKVADADANEPATVAEATIQTLAFRWTPKTSASGEPAK